MATRNGSAEWQGDLRGGSGYLTVGDSAFTERYSFESRFEEGEGTNPEELIAAAHAACFSMALATYGRARPSAESVRTTAKVHLRQRTRATIQQIDLARGLVPGIDQDIRRARRGGKKGCRVARAGRVERSTRAGCRQACSRQHRSPEFSTTDRPGPDLGAAKLGASVYELPPGEAVCPYHYELAEEEWLLVLEGRPTVRHPAGTSSWRVGPRVLPDRSRGRTRRAQRDRRGGQRADVLERRGPSRDGLSGQRQGRCVHDRRDATT